MMNPFETTAYYGDTAIRTVIHAEDSEAAMISAELSFVDASMIIVEPAQ